MRVNPRCARDTNENDRMKDNPKCALATNERSE